jgi:hypothetical protein
VTASVIRGQQQAPHLTLLEVFVQQSATYSTPLVAFIMIDTFALKFALSAFIYTALCTCFLAGPFTIRECDIFVISVIQQLITLVLVNMTLFTEDIYQERISDALNKSTKQNEMKSSKGNSSFRAYFFRF